MVWNPGYIQLGYWLSNVNNDGLKLRTKNNIIVLKLACTNY